ncbi:unnamed protein product [Spirodela intermedia]|uniref:Sialate O-acetylesterase domain-containing protein n=1 Tax=Spirodela intermedia TaxID=51605 RepID=A0A7I8JVP4_SPIIN|nr:unnamed protein product [Spirodela intermedia]CAA6673713.1 unnamed protein product [Spirodela intermedia]
MEAEDKEDRPEESPHGSVPRDVFVLAGQSNMSGRGGVRQRRWDGVVPPECRPRPGILRFSARSRWVEATCGIGPGMPFADAVIPHLLPSDGGEAAAGLVPCAVGGTAIKEWERGTRLYQQMLRAVLWYQGESDAATDHSAAAYGPNMEKLICDLRADLDLPSLPVIQVAITSGEGPGMEKVRRAQLGMHLPGVVCVDARGLPLNDDQIHLATAAQVTLGRMLAEAYVKNFLDKEKVEVVVG